MEDKLIVVYEGSYAQYRGDWLKDEYVNKLVIVTGDQSSTSTELRKSYLCVSNGEKSVAIPIPSVYLQGIMVDGAKYSYTDGYIRFAKANGIDLSFDVKTGDLSIGISEKLDSTISNLVANLSKVSTKADNAVSAAETASQNANKANNTISGVSNVVSSLRTTVEGHTSEIADIEGDVAENKAKIEAIEEDYISKGDAVDFATDLTGVVEATAEEFVYRPSAGEKSIRDKSAVIRRIKGNSVVWEQKLKSLTSDSWNQYSATYANIEFINNSATISLTSSYTGQNVYNIGLRYKPSGQKYLSGHVYLIVGLCKLQSGGKLLIEMTGQNFETNNISASPNKWVSFNTICSPTKDASTFYIKPPHSYANLREGSSYSISNVMLFDLTTMFGAGNEPATVEEFRAIYNDAYYPYCQPELRGVKTGAIKTVGFNLFDGNCARVIGGMTYIVSNYAAAYYSETKNGAQTAVLIKDGVYTPECSGYLYLTGTADATPCVHFQHSGVMDDKCAPYVEHTLNLPEILALFPNGMHAVGDVFDEINIDTYIQRCEYRDYVEGDESNAEVLTDGVHTVAKLTEPIITPLSEPIALDYYCEDWGSEEAIPASSASAPFRADIVYQFNAEGRIRDNSRNIDKLEKIVAPLKNIPSNASLATQDFVLSNIPTSVATATERRVVTVDEEIQYLLPNILYDYGATSYDRIELPPLVRGDAAFDNKWMVRFASLSSDNISIPFDVFWKDGIAPSWSAWCLCEMTFFKDAEGLYTYGEWKIYK